MQESFHTSFLREMACPVPSGFHAEYAAIAVGTLAWADRFDLLDTLAVRRKVVRADCARLGAAVYHDGYSRESAQLATDFMTWLYVHDDLWVDGVRREPRALEADHVRLMQALRGAPSKPDDHPLVHALVDVRRRLGEYGRDLGPFIDSVEQYLTAKFWESRNHLEQITPEVRLYIQMRSFGGGVTACFELGALVRPIHLNRHLRNHAYVQTLSYLANHLVCWANDIASLRKELDEGTTTNLVMALHDEHGLTWAEAMARAVSMWNQAMSAFTALAAELGDVPLSDDERDALEKYLVLLGSWVRGNLDYDHVVERFLSA